MNSAPLLASAAKTLLSARATNAVLRNAVRCSSHYKPPANWKPPHLDEMPVPQGSWQAAYEAKQKSYNLQLILGASFFVFTLAFIKTSGIIFFNFNPPELPEEK